MAGGETGDHGLPWAKECALHCADAAGAQQVLQPSDSLLTAASRTQGAHNPNGQTLNDIA